MAEVGVAASLIGIASFGIQLTTTLYNFGSTASSAQKQTDQIARHVSLYSEVLELLAQRIDEDEPIHSRKAVDLVDRIYDESYDLFESIEDLLPERSERISFMQKIKWNFRKTKVDVLISEIDYLRSTVNLLVNVLYAGKKLRTYRRKKRSKKAEEDVKVQFAKAQNAIVEQMNATSSKEEVVAAAERDDLHEQDAKSDENREQVALALTKNMHQIPDLVNNSAVIRFKDTLQQATTTSQERSLVMQNSISLLQDLLEQWTTLPEDTPGVPRSSPERRNEPSSLTKPAHATGLSRIVQPDEISHDRPVPTTESMNSAEKREEPIEEISGPANRSPNLDDWAHRPTKPTAGTTLNIMSEKYSQSQNRVKELEAELSKPRPTSEANNRMTEPKAEKSKPRTRTDIEGFYKDAEALFPGLYDSVNKLDSEEAKVSEGRNARSARVRFQPSVTPSTESDSRSSDDDDVTSVRKGKLSPEQASSRRTNGLAQTVISGIGLAGLGLVASRQHDLDRKRRERKEGRGRSREFDQSPRAYPFPEREDERGRSQEFDQSPRAVPVPEKPKSMLEALGVLGTVNNELVPDINPGRPEVDKFNDHHHATSFSPNIGNAYPPPYRVVDRDLSGNLLPTDARRTIISRNLVNPKALSKAGERFHYSLHDDSVYVYRVLNADEVRQLQQDTARIRGK